MTERLAPGATIGILGGGQLGRMAAMAAAELGYRCHVFSPEEDAPAKEVAAGATTAPYADLAAVRAFAGAVDVATFEFENVPASTLAAISGTTPVRPGARALQLSQERAVEKAFVNGLGVATPRWAKVSSPSSLVAASAGTGFPAILKTARFGYDGKGQVRIDSPADLIDAWHRIGEREAILESVIEFEREISVIAARGLDGDLATYVAVDNVHRDGILHTTTAPSAAPAEVAAAADGIARRIAVALDLVGLVAVEMFVVADGGVLVNEIAPRPHNSGHWTLDACAVSQFEQFVRAVAGLPLGDPARHSDAVMTNLIGDEVDSWEAAAGERGACLHLYGKAETRPGRKMGHVTRLSRPPPSP